MMHVDEFIDRNRNQWRPDRQERYAAWVLSLFRMCATLQSAWREFYSSNRLFCTHEGKRYRVTGASRMGDIWLAENHARDCGYDKRVDVETCSAWGAEP